jgi:putative ABC transport system permease protein
MSGTLRAWIQRMRGLFHNEQMDRELDDELKSHLEMHVADNLRAGMTAEEARRNALIKLGGVEQTKDSVRDGRGIPILGTLVQDVRFGVRMMRKSPGFAIVAVLTLALGIGANTAIFSIIDAVVLRPLPFRDPGHLVAVSSVDPKDATHGGEISYPAFLDWRSQTHSFEELSVWNTTNLTFTGGDQAESVRSAVVSSNLFSLLGVSPPLGRVFTSEEDLPSEGQLPVMLSYEFWQSHFGADPNMLGRAITLDNRKYSVVGIMPARFQYPVQQARVELWIPIASDLQGKNAMAAQRGVSYLQVVGRLKPGADISSAKADVQVVQERLNRQYPENRPHGVVIKSESQRVTGSAAPALIILLGAVGFLLLIACANVAGLLLGRATVRRKEFTVRRALGASRWTIVRQLLTESVLLAFAGGLSGLLVARWAISALVSIAPVDLARTSEIALDYRVLGFTFLVALATGVLFGLVPAFQAARSDMSPLLGDNTRGSSAGPDRSSLRSVLVTSQMAVAFVLLVGAGLLLRSFHRLQQVDPGFHADHVLTFLLDVPSERHAGAQRPVFVEELLQSTRALPGVRSASAVFGLPLSEDQAAYTTVEVEGHPVPNSQLPRAAFRIIESRYFQTMEIRLLKGRNFTPDDEQGGPPLAIVNEIFARQIFKGVDPLGKRIKPNISFGDAQDAPMREIVGVTADVNSRGIGEQAVPEVYAPQTPTDFIGEMTIVVRTMIDPSSLVPTMRSLVSSMDKDLPVRDVKTLDQYVDGSISAPRFEALLLGTFAALAFLLTVIGIYGVISYSVVQRTREMGIRVAMGASRGNISFLVLREGVLLALIGVGIGLSCSLFAVRLIRGLLFGVEASDPVTFIGVSLLLVSVSLLASYIPARRASVVDPMVALRYE